MDKQSGGQMAEDEREQRAEQLATQALQLATNGKYEVFHRSCACPKQSKLTGRCRMDIDF